MDYGTFLMQMLQGRPPQPNYNNGLPPAGLQPNQQLAGDVVGMPKPPHRTPTDIAYRQATGRWPSPPPLPVKPYPLGKAATLDWLRSKLLED